jgi:hypothetical protein
MDSLPEQRIEDLPGATQRDVYEKIGRLCALRARGGGYSEDEVAEKAGFGSAEAMYQQLKVWGLAGLLPGSTSSEVDYERKARRGDGQRQDLPPAAGARRLFEQALLSLMGRVVLHLMENIDELERREDYLQDERFVAKEEYRDPILWFRDRMPDAQWKGICARFGKNPDSDSFELWDQRFVEPAGATQSPQEPLTTLIAVYVLSGLPLEPLLEILHFAPEDVDRAELKRHIEGEKVRKRSKSGRLSTQHIPGLKTKAAHVAKLVYGGSLRRGPSTGELPPRDQNIIWYIQQREEEGVPDDQIYRQLKDKRGLTRDEYARLRRFRLDAP